MNTNNPMERMYQDKAVEDESKSEQEVHTAVMEKQSDEITNLHTLDVKINSDQDGSPNENVLFSLFNARVSIAEKNVRNQGSQDHTSFTDESNDVKTDSLQSVDTDELMNVDVDDLVGVYLKDAARLPLLTHEEEKELFIRVERGRLAREELGRGSVSSSRHQQLFQLVKDGSEARHHIVKTNTRLVVSVAKRYLGRGVPFLDLIQEGNIGLMRAIKKFDVKRGLKFSTYATWWIRQAVSRAVANQGQTIRMPVHIMDKLSRMACMKHKLTQKLQRDPTEVELGEALDISPKKVQRLLKLARFPLSLDKPINTEADTTFGELIENKQAADPEERSTNRLLRDHIEDLIEILPAREANVIRLRYGLQNGEMQTLQEVGTKIGVSRERVRQIEAVAMRRLRRSHSARKLRLFLD
jgi:RNA polymerase primary sigma factor